MPLGICVTSQSRATTICSFDDMTLFGGNSFLFSLKGGPQRMPGQSRTLYAERKFCNTGKDHQLAHGIIGHAMACNQVMEAGKDLLGFGFALPFQILRHDGSRGLGDGAAGPLKTNVLNRPVFHVYIDRVMVSAKRIVAFSFVADGIEHPEITRLPVVLLDDVIVKFKQLRHYPSTSTTLWIPFTSASTSARVLYSPKDARAVAGMPKRCMTG